MLGLLTSDQKELAPQISSLLGSVKGGPGRVTRTKVIDYRRPVSLGRSTDLTDLSLPRGADDESMNSTLPKVFSLEYNHRCYVSRECNGSYLC